MAVTASFAWEVPEYWGMDDEGTVYWYNGRDWQKKTKAEISVSEAGYHLPRRLEVPARDSFRIYTDSSGVWDVVDGKTRLSEKQGLPKPGMHREDRYRYLADLDTGFAIHRHNLLIEEDNGWVVQKHDLAGTRTLHSVARAKEHVYLGTGINGVFRAAVKHNTLMFKSWSEGLPCIRHDDKLCLFDEVSGIAGLENGSVCTVSSFSPGVYCRANSDAKFIRRYAEELNHPYDSIESWGTNLAVANSRELAVVDESGDLILRQTLADFKPERKNITLIMAQTREGKSVSVRIAAPRVSKSKQIRMAAANGKKLFYSSALNYRKNKASVHAMLSRKKFHGMVLDFKDDHGYVRYDSQIPNLKKWNAVRQKFTLKEIDTLVEKYDAYIVARIVVFKDPVLFRQPGYAIRDAVTGASWRGNEKEFWVDPFNPALATEYYIPLIREISKSRVAEIQFDYIRFPSDGAVHRTSFSHREGDMYYSEALENFLKAMRSATDKPISLDVYGYHGLYRASGRIGQDIPMISRYADVIAPMLYSSHFGTRYLTGGPKESRAYNLLAHSAVRSRIIANEQFVVRPWLQGFPMSTGIWGYGPAYFAGQVRGSEAGGIKGFTFWGSFEHMLHVEKSLSGDNFLP